MREKNLVILCIVFAVLVGLVFVKKSIKPEIPTTEEISDIVKSPINASNVTAMTLQLGDGVAIDNDNPKKVILVKRDGQWVNESQFGVNARDTVINPVLEKLDTLKGELRSNQANLLNDYGISDEEGIHIDLLRSDADALKIVIGTQKAGNRNNFVRLGGSNAVYVVNVNLLGALGVRTVDDEPKLDINRWADKRIGQINVSEVIGIEITESIGDTQTKVIDIKREVVDDKKQWQSTPSYAFGLSASKIKNMIEAFNGTYAKEIVAPEGEGVFDAPGWTGVFTMEDGKQVKFVRGAKSEDGSSYYVKREGAGYYYIVPESTFHSRVNQQGGIFANNPLKVQENNVEGFEIHDLDSKKKFSVVKKTAVVPAQENAEGEASEDQEAKEEIVWEAPDGSSVDSAKINKFINALKSINLDIVSRPAMSLKDTLNVRVTKEGETSEYKFSEVFKTDTNKECHFLSVNSESYCAPKSSISALRNALP